MTTSAILALATGLPAVVTRHSGLPDQVIDGYNGFLSHEADPQDLADKIELLISQSDKWAQMSRNARELVRKKYDKEVLIKKNGELYQELAPGAKDVTFVVNQFPAISESWLINQICDLIDEGYSINIFAFQRGDHKLVSERYHQYKLDQRTTYIELPKNVLLRMLYAIPKAMKLALYNPKAYRVLFDTEGKKSVATLIKHIFWLESFIHLKTDLVHCHYGIIAKRFVLIDKALQINKPLLTSFYGYDVSSVVREKGAGYYDSLKRHCSAYIVMSENMKDRVSNLGFKRETLNVLPISEDIESMPFRERKISDGEEVKIVTIGRLVEKKGFDDFLQALNILKERTSVNFRCSIIGNGEMESDLRTLCRELGLDDRVTFEGYKKVQDIVPVLLSSHIYVQPSKTASNGDIE